jgi:hypothetical protein
MLGSLSIESSDNRLTREEIAYWKRIFKSNIKIGVEIESYIDDDYSPSQTIEEMKSLFSPTNDVGKFGDFGVQNVKSDGSISHGFELCTIGRRPNFLDLYYQYKAITNLVISKYKAHVNSRCGLHNHVLIDYGSYYTSVEKLIPNIIFINFVQLTRRYLPELVYITSTVKENNAITRYDSFCKADTLLQFTPLNRSVKDYMYKLKEEGRDVRYKFLNCRPSIAKPEGIECLHFELRFPDGSLYPAQIAAQNMLYCAMLIKAIELSELGVINTGDVDEWNETKELYAAIRNSDDEDRLSSIPTQEQMERIKSRTHNMLLELKPQLDQYDIHIYGILFALAIKPISLMRRESTDIEINAMFDDIIRNIYTIDISDCSDIIYTINLQKLLKCNSQLDYENKLAHMLNTSVSNIQKKLFKLNNVKPFEFDITLGALKFK